jgi:hypothetical protein
MVFVPAFVVYHQFWESDNVRCGDMLLVIFQPSLSKASGGGGIAVSGSADLDVNVKSRWNVRSLLFTCVGWMNGG